MARDCRPLSSSNRFDEQEVKMKPNTSDAEQRLRDPYASRTVSFGQNPVTPMAPGRQQDPAQKLPMGLNPKPAAPAIQKPPEPRRFTAEERTLVKKVLANIVNFMEEDNKSGRDLLGPFDPRNTGIILAKDLERAMYDDLFMVQDANTNLFVEYYSDHMGRVILGTILSDLERFRKARVDKKNYDLTLVKEHLAANRLALVPKEKLAGYVPPKSEEKFASRMKERIEQIKDYFYYEHGWSNQQLFEKLDVNKDSMVTKREFFKRTIDDGMQDMTRDELDEVFKFVDSNKNGVISLKEFK